MSTPIIRSGIEELRERIRRLEGAAGRRRLVLPFGLKAIDRPEADVSDLIDTLANRVGEQHPYRLAPIASDVPERSVQRIAPAASNTGEARGVRRRVKCTDGPERMFGEWWKRDAELSTVRDYFRVEDEAGERFWIFRSGDGEDATTGSHRWYLHGIFG
jgi:protein ImuB